jgi:hypothetical protein
MMLQSIENPRFNRNFNSFPFENSLHKFFLLKMDTPVVDEDSPTAKQAKLDTSVVDAPAGDSPAEDAPVVSSQSPNEMESNKAARRVTFYWTIHFLSF